MANLTETETYESGVYQWETNDPAQGGASGVMNTPTRQLANRTKWLKARVDGILGDYATEQYVDESIFLSTVNPIMNANFNYWPEGVSFTKTGLTEQILNFYGPANWFHWVSLDPSPGDNATARIDRIALSGAERTMCGGVWGSRFRMTRAGTNIFRTSGGDRIGIGQTLLLDEATQLFGGSVRLRLCARSNNGQNQTVTPWIAAKGGVIWNDRIADPIVLTPTMQVFEIDFPIDWEVVVLQTWPAFFYFMIETFRGNTYSWGPRPFADYDFVIGYAGLSPPTAKAVDLPPAMDWARCQRYWHSSYPPDVAPGTPASVGSNFFSTNTQWLGGTYRFPTLMARVPAITFYSPISGAVNRIDRWDNVVVNSDIQTVNASQGGISTIGMPSTGILTANTAYEFNLVADARVYGGW